MPQWLILGIMIQFTITYISSCDASDGNLFGQPFAMLGFLWNFRLRNPFLSDRSNSRSISSFFFFRSAVARGGICVLIPSGRLIAIAYLLEIKYIACLLFSSMKLDLPQSNQEPTESSHLQNKRAFQHKDGRSSNSINCGFSGSNQRGLSAIIFDKYFITKNPNIYIYMCLKKPDY